tara:strand:- start:171 stop:908 length:738 start_codon:yes stop_codon:yes gene_type:complete
MARKVPDVRETDGPWFLHDHEECQIFERPGDRWSKPKSRRWNGKKTAKIWYVAEKVPDFVGTFDEFKEHEEFLISELNDIGFEVEIIHDQTGDGLITMLQGEADYRLVAGHGDEYGGIRATDRFVEWDEIIENIGVTGILHMLSCYSFDAIVEDEEGAYDFVDGIIDSTKVTSAIVCHKMGHHFPGVVESTRESFEISRIMCILERCIDMGFREGIESYRTEITTMLGSGAKPFTDHEIALGNPN